MTKVNKKQIHFPGTKYWTENNIVLPIATTLTNLCDTVDFIRIVLYPTFGTQFTFSAITPLVYEVHLHN